MRNNWLITCLATLLIMGQAAAADQAKKAEVAVEKAEVLEQNSAADGSMDRPASSEVITKSEAQAVDPAGKEDLNDAITCFARTIYWEARGRGVESMETIANVVMNRLGHEGFSNTICEVVMEGQEQGDCQFSWWCDGRSDNAKEDESYAKAKEIARKALNRQLKDRTFGALYFHHHTVSPSWSTEYIKTFEDGTFVFYKPRGGTAK